MFAVGFTLTTVSVGGDLPSFGGRNARCRQYAAASRSVREKSRLGPYGYMFIFDAVHVLLIFESGAHVAARSAGCEGEGEKNAIDRLRDVYLAQRLGIVGAAGRRQTGKKGLGRCL